jgi:thiol-disulfide isomerase/thioredoxin
VFRRTADIAALFFLIASAAFTGCGGSSAFMYEKEPSGERVLVGEFPRSALMSDTAFSGWFNREHDTFQPEQRILAKLPEVCKKCEIIICMGTWCSDSRKEVPRFFKIAETVGIPPENIRLFGVNHRKQSPQNTALKYKVTKVPTFIFLLNGKELGRIVEAPDVSLESDMVQILRSP